jgi:hypothetical protein
MKDLIHCAIAALALTPVASIGQTLAPSQDTYFVPKRLAFRNRDGVGSSASVRLVQFDLTHSRRE